MKFSLWRPARFHHQSHLEGVLGTSLELQIVSTARALGAQIERDILLEIDRLEAIFSLYNSDSEFNRWQQTNEKYVAISGELAQVLAWGESWRARSHGAFNPTAECLTQLWKDGAQTGIVPDANELQALAREIAAPLWSVDLDTLRARRLTAWRASLNSIAKGFIVDRAVLVAQNQEAVEDILVNIGGDLRHAGQQTLPVNIADPFTRADNAAPIARIGLHNASLATSGRARRGFEIGERWFSHVLDPRNGQPVADTVSASVVASDALTADVLATICSVVSPDEAIAFVDELPDVAACLVSEVGEIKSNVRWHDLII